MSQKDYLAAQTRSAPFSELKENCMDHIITGWIVAFFISFYSIPVIIQIAADKKLYDLPDERKVHKNPISSLGGIGIFAGLLVSCLLNISFSANPEFQYYILSFLIIFFLGVKDDIVVISAHKKFIGQIFAAVILIFKAKLIIGDMQGFLGFGVLNESFAWLLTAFTILVTINAFNLIDGVDGLAGTVASVTFITLGILFAINQDWSYAILAFCASGAVASFLIYNYQPARIFMGDTGSLLIGTVASILVIHFIAAAPTYGKYPVPHSAALGFAVILVPLLDTLRVFALRIFKRRSPFSPDRNHFHHFLLDRGLNHRTVTLTIAFCSVGFIGLELLLAPYDSTLTICTLILLFFALIYVLYITRHAIGMKVVGADGNIKTELPKAAVKLVNIFDSKSKTSSLEQSN